MDVGVVIFGTDGGAIGGMRIAAGSGGGAMDVVEIMATKKGRGGFLSSKVYPRFVEFVEKKVRSGFKSIFWPPKTSIKFRFALLPAAGVLQKCPTPAPTRTPCRIISGRPSGALSWHGVGGCRPILRCQGSCPCTNNICPLPVPSANVDASRRLNSTVARVAKLCGTAAKNIKEGIGTNTNSFAKI
jgi:hypothetical protein